MRLFFKVGDKSYAAVDDRVREFTWNLGTLKEGYENVL